MEANYVLLFLIFVVLVKLLFFNNIIEGKRRRRRRKKKKKRRWGWRKIGGIVAAASVFVAGPVGPAIYGLAVGIDAAEKARRKRKREEERKERERKERASAFKKSFFDSVVDYRKKSANLDQEYADKRSEDDRIRQEKQDKYEAEMKAMKEKRLQEIKDKKKALSISLENKKQQGIDQEIKLTSEKYLFVSDELPGIDTIGALDELNSLYNKNKEDADSVYNKYTGVSGKIKTASKEVESEKTRINNNYNDIKLILG